MPQIPGLPTNDPVSRPKASPREFGSVGGAVADMGYETQQLAAAASDVEGHLIAAQRQLKAKQAEIAFGAAKQELYNELSKATTTEQAQEMYDHAKGRLDSVLTPFETDRVLSRNLGIYRQQEDVEIRGTLNAKKADIITKSDKAANEVLYGKSQQNAITTTVGGGSPDQSREQFRLQLESSVAHGTMLPEQRDAAMEAWEQDYEKGVIEAYTNSPDPSTRKQNIASLKSGESFPHLDKATTNALMTKAMSRDRELTNLAESEDYNGAVNHFDGLTQGWTYENKIKALESGDWLKQNGFVDGNGQPDRKKADMLAEEADRSEARQRKIQNDKDTEVISKHAADADAGKLTDPQIDLIVKEEGGSPKAAGTLRSVLRQHINQVRSDYKFSQYAANAGTRTDNRNAKANGEKASAELFRKLDKGDTIDPQTDIWDKVDSGDMTVAQARKLETAREAHKRADYRDNNARIVNAPGISDQAKGKMQLELLDATNQQNLQGQNMRTFTDNLLKDHATEQTGNFIQRLYNSITGGGPISANAPAKPTTSGPKEGDTKTNSSGDNVKFVGGKWVPN